MIFNGNGYDESWKDEATKRGIWRIDSGVDAMAMLTSEKNVKLFETLNIMKKDELAARQHVSLEHYTSIVEMECLAMVDMMNQQVLPAVKEAKMDFAAIEDGVKKLKAGLDAVHHESDILKRAALARIVRALPQVVL